MENAPAVETSTHPAAPPYYSADQVDALLDLDGCIDAMRRAMIAFSRQEGAKPLREIVKLETGNLFGIMPGELASLGIFGAKLVSVFNDPAQPGRSRHQGMVVAYDARSGAVLCTADAEAVTLIRTGCMTAAATDALARRDARVLAVFGTGSQARSHILALSRVRRFERIVVWGRDWHRADALAKELASTFGLPVEPISDGREAAEMADVICTVTASREPVLLGEWVRPGTHVNLVGSSYLGPVEVDTALVAASRYIADSRASVLAQASELEVAREAGAIDDTHVVGEIGEVFAGAMAGRKNDEQVTVFKSLGSVAQDLAATGYLHERATVRIG